MTTTTSNADLYRRLAADLTRRVEAIPADRWDNPSPCEGWTARDVVRHIVETHSFPVNAAGMTLPAVPDVDADPVGAWTQTRDAVQEILDDPDRADREYEGQMGRAKVSDIFGSFYTFDLVVHGWDLAKATGGDTSIASEDLTMVAHFAERMGDSLHTPGVCGPTVEVPADADELTRVLGLVGRRA
ncbi:TIGR03086 family metal-binding protein [Rhodococcus sp. NPDC058481]|uniref:TIGR03086 family metal-binding protein n=1 Tax=unclassified Rhodococcus (in: high G+C Gram-positive bacteria) TaxID=192944 RepID=UPI00365B5F00